MRANYGGVRTHMRKKPAVRHHPLWRYKYDRLGDYFLQSLHDLVFTTLLPCCHATRSYPVSDPDWLCKPPTRQRNHSNPSGWRGFEIPIHLPSDATFAFHSEITRERMCILDLKVNSSSPANTRTPEHPIKVQASGVVGVGVDTREAIRNSINGNLITAQRDNVACGTDREGKWQWLNFSPVDTWTQAEMMIDSRQRIFLFCVDWARGVGQAKPLIFRLVQEMDCLLHRCWQTERGLLLLRQIASEDTTHGDIWSVLRADTYTPTFPIETPFSLIWSRYETPPGHSFPISVVSSLSRPLGWWFEQSDAQSLLFAWPTRNEMTTTTVTHGVLIPNIAAAAEGGKSIQSRSCK